MPVISAFFGIVIRMFYKEHEPAHFHAEYAAQQAKLTSTARSSPARFGPGRRVSEFVYGRCSIALSSKRIGRR